MSGNNGFVTRSQAAELLGVSPRTIGNYVDAMLLSRHGNGRYGAYSREELVTLKEKIAARRDLGDDVKEIFAMFKCGIPLWKIKAEFKVDDERIINTALQFYMNERQTYMRQFGLTGNEHKYLLLTEEILRRLKVRDVHIVGDLVRSGELESYPATRNGYDKFLVILPSFLEYLGDYSDKMLSTSEDIAEKLGVKVSRVDKMRRNLGIGFKLKKCDQGILLFSEDDVERMTEYQKRYEQRLSQSKH